MIMNMKIAVCDDEEAVREDIGRKIRSLYQEADIRFFANGGELLNSGESFAIIFLDIRMNGINGIETAKSLRKKGSDAELIFITALEEYVFQAFDVEAFHYLVKPFSTVKFYEVLHMAVRKTIKKRQAKKECRNGSARNDERETEKSILLKIGKTTVKVFLKDIVYAEVFNRKIVLYTTDKELEFYGRMSELEQKLGDGFFRCHRAYLVHLRYVSRYDANSILLENGVTVGMAKQKYETFVKQYFNYIRREEK